MAYYLRKVGGITQIGERGRSKLYTAGDSAIGDE